MHSIYVYTDIYQGLKIFANSCIYMYIWIDGCTELDSYSFGLLVGYWVKRQWRVASCHLRLL